MKRGKLEKIENKEGKVLKDFMVMEKMLERRGGE